MHREDLIDILAFARYKHMMQCPLTKVLPLYLQDLQDRLEEHVADQELMGQLEL